jgi:glycosyltransferase involved in cell wall biosynthesis
MGAMKILIAIPYTKFIETRCWESLLNMERPADTASEVRTYSRYSVAMARNVAAKEAVDGGFDYIWFVDSDMIIPPDALIRLRGMDADFATGWALSAAGGTAASIASYDAGGNFFYGMHADWVRGHAEPFEVDGSGLSCTLIKTDVFKTLDYPYFQYVEYASGEVLSEDFGFCLALRGAGKKMRCDPALKAGHIKHIVI